MIGAGAFDRRVDIERLTQLRDAGTNAVVESWAVFLPGVPASVRQAPGREFLEANQITSERRAVFTIRYTDVTVIDRVSYEGRLYNISDVRELGRRRFLELQCEAVE